MVTENNAVVLPDAATTVARLTAIIESAPTAMVMIDSTGRIVLVNREAELLFRYRRDELLGQPVEVLVPEEFRPKHPGMRSGFLGRPTSRRMGAGRDLFALRKDGSEFPVEIGLNPIETEDGTFVISAIVDITGFRFTTLPERPMLPALTPAANRRRPSRRLLSNAAAGWCFLPFF